MADTASPAPGSGLEARVARLETDVGEIRAILNRLASRIDEMYGFMTAKLPELATKADLTNLRAWVETEFATQRSEFSDLRSETKIGLANQRSEAKTDLANLRAEMTSEFANVRGEIGDLRLEIARRPTRRRWVVDIFSNVGLIGAILTIAARLAH